MTVEDGWEKLHDETAAEVDSWRGGNNARTEIVFHKIEPDRKCDAED